MEEIDVLLDENERLKMALIRMLNHQDYLITRFNLYGGFTEKLKKEGESLLDEIKKRKTKSGV